MADVEQRLAAVEREIASLKARVGVIDEDMKNIPDLIKTEHRFTNSQIVRLSRDLDDVRGKVDAMVSKVDSIDAKIGDMDGKVEALPRIVAELVVEMINQRDGRP